MTKYYDPYRVITKNRLMNFITGGRRIGKTYGFKKALLKLCLSKGYKMAYVRRRKTELDNMMSYLDKLADDPDFKGYKFEEKRVQGVRTLKVNDEVVVSMYALSQSANMRSSGDFANYQYILFDEFLPEDGRYIRDEVDRLLNVIETIFRENSSGQVFCIANAKKLNNPYFEFFDTYPRNKEFTYNTDKSLLIQIVDMVAPSKIDKDAPFEKLIKGTSYGDMSTNNMFLDDNDDFIEKRPVESIELATLELDGKLYGLWVAKHGTMYYISRHYTSTQIFTADGQDLKYPYLFKNPEIGNNFERARWRGNLRFEDNNIRETFRLLLSF